MESARGVSSSRRLLGPSPKRGKDSGGASQTSRGTPLGAEAARDMNLVRTNSAN